MEFLSPRTPEERHLSGSFRLSCRTHVAADAGAIRCHTMRRGQMRIERRAAAAGAVGDMALDPVGERAEFSATARSTALRWTWGPPRWCCASSTWTPANWWPMHRSKIRSASAASDVMARIQYDTQHPGKLLRRTLAGYLTHAIEELPVDPREIREMVVVGNSTMRDLFFRQSVYSIGQSPYQSITEIEMAEGKRATTSLIETGRRCLLPIHPQARVYGRPVISGHVGADAAACMLAVDLAQRTGWWRSWISGRTPS